MRGKWNSNIRNQCVGLRINTEVCVIRIDEHSLAIPPLPLLTLWQSTYLNNRISPLTIDFQCHVITNNDIYIQQRYWCPKGKSSIVLLHQIPSHDAHQWGARDNAVNLVSSHDLAAQSKSTFNHNNNNNNNELYEYVGHGLKRRHTNTQPCACVQFINYSLVCVLQQNIAERFL